MIGRLHCPKILWIGGLLKAMTLIILSEKISGKIFQDYNNLSTKLGKKITTAV